MIEPMTNVTVICLAQDRQATVNRLADLGLVHVTDVQPPSSDELDRLTERRDRLHRARLVLDATAEDVDELPENPAVKPDTADALAEAVSSAVNDRSEANDRRLRLNRIAEELAPWGSFTQDRVESLEAAGYALHLGMAREDQLPETPEGAFLHEISRSGKTVRFAVVAPPDAELPFEPIPFPEITDAQKLQTQLEEAEIRHADANDRLLNLAPHRHMLNDQIDDLDARIALCRARDGMGTDRRLAYLQGYAPKRQVDAIRDASNEAGWGLRIQDADPNEPAVPTKLHIPKVFQIARPIFEFLGILPGYHETDVSIAFLIFLTLFFGMIVGDAGYGVLFLGVAVLLRLTNTKPERVLPLNLFILMSTVTVVWGVLSGNVFALPRDLLPRGLRGIDALTGEHQYQNLQWFCFLIASIHLSLARLGNTVLRFGSRQAIGHLGWALIIWGNFFTASALVVGNAFPQFAYILYVVGAVLVLSCSVNWTDFGDVFGLPFDAINSFVDLLSYIRLFAVGLSTYFIADSFNDMGAMVFDLSPWLLPGAILVIFLGHVLNIGLAFLGVLVHGVRLNALEFSNQMGLTWSGHPYTPLSRNPQPEA